MKRILLILALVASIFNVSAQETEPNAGTGDLFNGFTRPLTFNRMIAPYGLEVTFFKTVHIIFPAGIRYVDLGSIDLLAAKADGAENVLRVKAATRGFRKETNLSVITEDGSFYAFNVKYADEPVKLNIEMADFLHASNNESEPENKIPVYFSDLGSESPYFVLSAMETIYKNNRMEIKHIGSRSFGIQFILKGIYSHNELLFFHLSLKNSSAVPFFIDCVTFKITDKKVVKRTAVQEQVITPLRSYIELTRVAGGKEEQMVFTLPVFTIPNDKQLVIELTEKNGGRNQRLTVENADLVQADVIDNLPTKKK